MYYYIKSDLDKLINFTGKSIVKNPAKYKDSFKDLRGHNIFNIEDIKAINKASERFYKYKEKDDFKL